ncbi:phosphorylcholine transferase LicD [uncultured Methanobrevibacter sp.]|uniref:LicD family protein n=1 Tax=uncultured Methanobrevibacter sp. TaxID=253161 RepID=UPI002613F1E5|nr:LicD family protein [uncultured Methanobrevibacter sp.]
MNFDELYYKLPKKIRYSENFIIFCKKLVKTLHMEKKPASTSRYTVNYLFKSSDIKIEGTLRNIQLLYVELLRFIDNICNKYNLEYFLAYGTLLGAIRHEGFIPWDDDCDIIMMRKDYDKLIEVLPYEINNHIILKENIGLTKLLTFKENYFESVKTLYDEDLGHDVYFYDYNKAPGKLTDIDNPFLPRICKSLFLQIGWLKPMVRLDIFPHDFIKEDSVNHYKKYYSASKILFRNSFAENDFNFDKEFNVRFDKLGLTLDETNFIGEGIDASDDDLGVYDKNIFFPVKTQKFEGYYLKCPNKSEELLKRWYGENYMDIPINLEMHGYSEYNSSFFKSNEEMKNAFENAIYELKKINDEFK